MTALICTSAFGASAFAQGLAPMPVMEEVPFITTPDNVTVSMLELAGVSSKDFVLDLGSGDGRIVITAARRFGARGLGVEIVPELVERSRRNAQAAGVADKAEFREQDLFKTDLTAASVITMYLLPAVNLQLRPALLGLKPGTRLVSHDWDMGQWTPDRTWTVEAPTKSIGREKLSQLHLWVVPAPVAGLWCGPAGLQWQLGQEFQMLRGQAGRTADLSLLLGRVDGNTLHVWAPGAYARAERRQGPQADVLQVMEASGPWTSWRGQALRKAAGDQCMP
ncbi:MAG: class I SAM-dependent methyltransferase [Betaproteobacteria bacterium]